MMRDEAEAEDVAQETFLKAFRALATFRFEARFSTWLERIALNEGRMRLRHLRSHKHEPLNEDESDSEEHIPLLLSDWREIPSEALEQSADWAPADIRDGKFYVRAELNGKKLDSVLYDTGTSPDDLSVDLDVWKEASGKAGPKEASTRIHAQSWGEQIEVNGTRATGDLLIGRHRFHNPRLTTVPSRPTSYRDSYFGAQGALGNALFLDSIVILDLWAHPRFGIISP